MLEDLASDRRRRGRMVQRLLGKDVEPAVAEAMLQVPRHWFMPQDLIGRAYDDCALPIGSGQTISQPSLVARMLSWLELASGMRVLDVGAGSGYASALIARLVAPARVVAVERQGSLIAATSLRLERIAPSVDLRLGDALAGLPGEAPFAAIHVACACAAVPPALLALLAPLGRLVVPVGGPAGWQRLMLIIRNQDASLTTRDLGEVLFVPGLPGIAG